MCEQPRYYTVIPADVSYDKRLSDSEKMLYGDILALSRADGYCWATNAYFEKRRGWGKRTVQRYIKTLEQCGYIDVTIVRKDTKEVDKRVIVPLSLVEQDDGNERQNCREGHDNSRQEGHDNSRQEGHDNSRQEGHDTDGTYNNININNTFNSTEDNSIKGENEFFAHSRPESDEVIDVEVIDETPQAEQAQKDDYAQGDFQLEQEVVHVKPKTAERGKYSEEFEAFWKVYPVRRVKKKLAYEQWKKTIKTVSVETIMQGLKRVKQGDVTYMPEPMRWLRDGRWEDEPDYSSQMKNPALQRAQQNQQMADYIRQNAAKLETLDPWA